MQNKSADKIWLSGTGSDHTVDWDFFCTAGQNSGKWSKIAVPSNWELQGFGSYNYGLDKDSLRLNEKGLYRYHFSVPSDWKNKVVRIVFDGVMTDAIVKINGKIAGPIHQGAFYSFKYDISGLLHYGKDNELEVTVAKNSANISVNKAERKGDFWIFGGIFRPVYLEMLPEVFMDRVSVDAKADGSFKALIHIKGTMPAKKANELRLTAQLYGPDGHMVGNLLKAVVSSENNSPTAAIDPKELIYSVVGDYSNIKTWTPETPWRYKVVFTLNNGVQAKGSQQLSEEIGFRTVEVRPSDGIYVNGVKIKFKGVNHHSFWPTTGRTSSKAQSITDVLMLKDLNMNAVRMSHYPPDAHFLDACDSLGLFVLDELTGWHQHYDTQVGTKLVGEMMVKDENHPSIVMWDNGNEGGFNFDLDPLFTAYDLQKRPLIHPWAIFGDMDTQHYINYDYGAGTHLHGHQIVFPTEFLHGLYDGGLGAGLGDYWRQMWASPLSAGGFLWVFADEAVVRTDKKGILDADGDHGPDGIVGPYHEKEGSYNAIKEIWSPVYIEPREITGGFDGSFRVENRYFYTNLNKLTYQWAWMDGGSAGKTQLEGVSATLSSAVPKDSGTLAKADVPNIAPGQWGRLKINLPPDFTKYDYLQLKIKDAQGHILLEKTYPVRLPKQKTATIIRDLETLSNKGSAAVKTTATLKIDSIGEVMIVSNGAGFSYQFSKKTGQLQKAVYGGKTSGLTNGPVLCEGDAIMKGFKVEDMQDSVVLTASFDKKSDLSKLQWVVYKDGLLKMQIAYFPHQYDFDYMGVSFDFPESQVKGIDRMGAGPYRVWKNRMEGVRLGVWHNEYNNTVTGQNTPKMVYPEFKGYFSQLYWMRLRTTALPLTVLCADEDIFLRLFTPRTPLKPANTAPAFPKGDISFMHAINPIGTKSQVAENMGPSGRKNMYYDYGKDKDYAKPLTLYFYFGD